MQEHDCKEECFIDICHIGWNAQHINCKRASGGQGSRGILIFPSPQHVKNVGVDFEEESNMFIHPMKCSTQ